MKKPIAMLLPLALAGPLAACSEQGQPPPPTQMFLPTAEVLPYRFNQDCGCVRDGGCAVVEEQPGYSEVRNLECRWLRPKAVAQCRYEERFTAHHYLADGNFIESAGEWKPQSLRAVLLPDGRWCAG